MESLGLIRQWQDHKQGSGSHASVFGAPGLKDPSRVGPSWSVSVALDPLCSVGFLIEDADQARAWAAEWERVAGLIERAGDK